MKHLVIILMLFLSLEANTKIPNLNDIQSTTLEIAYEVGEMFVTSDGYALGELLSGITLQESSAGVKVLGDRYGDKYYYKHKNKRVYIHKKEIFVKNKTDYAYYKKYRKRVYTLKGQLKTFYESSLGAFQIKLSTAKETIRKDKKLKKLFSNLLEDDTELVNELLLNVRFSATIAATYLKKNYELALKRGYKNPLKSTISRYNGGWKNYAYISKVLKRMLYVKSILRFINK